MPVVSSIEMLLNIPSRPGAFSYLTDNLTARSVYSLISMDDSDVTFDQVCRIITHDRSNFTQDMQSVSTINVFYALKHAENSLTDPLTPEFAASVHAELTRSMNVADAGTYRKTAAHCEDGETGWTPPASALDINFLMKHLTEWLTCDETAKVSPFLKGLLLHLHLKKIQPFSTANGKTAAITSIFLMRKLGLNDLPYLMQEVFASNREEYLKNVSEFYRTSDISGFADFTARRLIMMMKDGIRTSLATIRHNSVEKYLAVLLDEKELIKRQHDFLLMLYRTGNVFRYEDMLLKKPFTNYYGKVSRTTAARDIKKFIDMGLLSESADGYAFNSKFLSI
ncbi:Fic family protein [Seleniivibrio sp.]|uniref:Fic family protein n=1 Tax=Seleniivibrio sp. TaxID=2898801 RepID=UPI0025DBF132|nr:Fic family protein [Seleniivibrio sp.]